MTDTFKSNLIMLFAQRGENTSLSRVNTATILAKHQSSVINTVWQAENQPPASQGGGSKSGKAKNQVFCIYKYGG